MNPNPRDRRDPLAELIKTYSEFNSTAIQELDEEPSPLEFHRFVARNTPFVVRRGAAAWKASTTWNAAFLRDLIGHEKVNVAVTPEGNADAPARTVEGGIVFAKPWEEEQNFADFLDYVMQQEKGTAPDGCSEVSLTQENDNLRHEYVSLFSHVQRDIAFARIALEREPEAINMWVGNSRSVTALHKDNYENIYVQVLGRKHFVLLPPVCHPCINEQELQPATYKRRETAADGHSLCLELEVGDGVPWATWDPDRPGENATPYSHLAEPMRVTLEPGDMLYLPAMWYHKVSQSCSEEGICVAVNYWYDMDYTGPLLPMTTFVRAVDMARTGSADN